MLICGIVTPIWALNSLANTVAAAKPQPAQVSAVVAEAPKSHLKSFADWKNEKITQSQEQVRGLQSQLAAAKHAGLAAEATSLQVALSEAVWNADVAADLSVTDYAVLYLAGQPGAAKLHEAASKLSTEDTTKLLEAYLQILRTQRESGSMPMAKLPRHAQEE